MHSFRKHQCYPSPPRGTTALPKSKVQGGQNPEVQSPRGSKSRSPKSKGVKIPKSKVQHAKMVYYVKSSINLGGRNLTFLKTAFFFKNHCEFLVFRRREDFYFLLEICIQNSLKKKVSIFGSLLIF